MITHLDDTKLVQLAAETARQLESVWDEVRLSSTIRHLLSAPAEMLPATSCFRRPLLDAKGVQLSCERCS
jgi:hypothetical protein